MLFESCRGTLLCRAQRILRRPQDAEDAVQEAMLAAFTHLDQFQGRADFLTWATRIVINAALMQIRKGRLNCFISWDQLDGQLKESALNEILEDPKPNPEEMCRLAEQRKLAEEALEQLSGESRKAIQLCKFCDYSLKEAASKLGLSLSSLKLRLHRGQRSLRLKVKNRNRQDVSRFRAARFLWCRE